MNIMNLYVYENRNMSNDLSKPIMLENLNVDNVQIHIPKEIDGTDMGTWAWWFVYQNAKREKYSIPMTIEGVTNDEGEEEYISTVGLNHGFTGKHGSVMYAIEAVQADGSGAVTHEWHTRTYKLEIVTTLQGNQTEYSETESDIISALISRVNELITSGAEIAEIAETIESAAETAQEVIDSIPPDYSELSNRVGANTIALAEKADQATTYTKKQVDQMIADVEVETDTTLSVSGAPADAKKVGDELSDINESLGAQTETIENIEKELSNLVSTVSVTGDVIEVSNASEGAPDALVAIVSATQSGEGMPSPTNVRTINGTSQFTITHTDESGESAEHSISLSSTLYGGEVDVISGKVKKTVHLYDLSQITWSTQSLSGKIVFWCNFTTLNPAVAQKASADTDFYGLCDKYAMLGYTPMTKTTNAISVRNDGSVKRLYVVTDGTAETTPTGHALLEIAEPTETTIEPIEVELASGYNKFEVSSGDLRLEYVPDISALYELKDNLTSTQNLMAGNEDGAIAVEDHAIGSTFIRNSKLAQAVTDIEVGDTLSATSNYQLIDGNLNKILDDFVRYGEYQYSEYVQGGREQSAPFNIITSRTARCTSKQVFPLRVGDTITVSNIPSGQKFAIGTPNYDSGWKASRFSYTAQADTFAWTGHAKTDGSTPIVPSEVTAVITVTDGSSRLANIGTGEGIEDYYVEEMADTIEKVRAVNDEPALVFPLVTDIHRYTASVQTFTEMIENIKHFSEKVKCDFLVNLGDLIEGASAKATSLGYAYDSMELFKSIGLPILWTEGNHDGNPYYSSGSATFSLKEMYSAFYSAVRADGCNLSENGTDYYIDFDGLGIRVISLNACNTSVNIAYAYGESTAQWFANVALDTDYKVILIEHLSSIVDQVWNKSRPANNTAITSAIQSFISGGGDLIQLSGHSHVDIAFIKPWLSIMQVCQKFEKADISTSAYGMITGYIDVLGNPTRTAETYTADAWSACIYKPISNEFDMIRFGAGVDRYFHVTPISPTTVTRKLSGTLTWSTSDATVATVSGGVITGVGSGRCGILAKDADGNYECWIVEVN